MKRARAANKNTLNDKPKPPAIKLTGAKGIGVIAEMLTTSQPNFKNCRHCFAYLRASQSRSGASLIKVRPSKKEMMPPR